MTVEMTVQEACDYSVHNVVAQGDQALDLSGGCIYKSNEGKRCAIGWLMNDTNPEAFILLGGLHLLKDRYPETLPAVVLDNFAIFRLLQYFHDSPATSVRIAYKRRLDVAGVDTSAEHWREWVTMGKV